MDTKATKNQISESELQNEIYHGIVLLRAIKYPHFKNEYKKNVDETYLETELRKIVRQKGMPTRTKEVGTKDGNLNRSATLIGPDSTVFAQVGYGIVNPDIDDVKTVATHDFGSGKGKKRKFANNLNRNQDTKKSLKLQLQNLKDLVMKGKANGGNEVVLDIKNNGKIRFLFAYQIGTIYSNEEKYSPQTKRLLTFYIKEKIKMSLGEDLPIFEYLPNIPYPKEFKEGNISLREYISAQPDAMNELASDRQLLFALRHFLKKQETCVVNAEEKNPLEGIDYEKELENAIREGHVFVRSMDDTFGYNTNIKKQNETALETELRQISKHTEFPELKSIPNEDGLVGATTTLIMENTDIEEKWGYGIINSLLSDIKNIKKDVSLSNNEVSQNISYETPISFVFAKKGYEINALCCKEKFKNIAEKDLPVFLYAKGDSPKLYNFEQEDLQKFINTTSDVNTVITLFDYYKNNEKVLSKIKSFINSDTIVKYLSGNMHYSNFENALKLVDKLDIPMNSDIKKTVKDFISNIENNCSIDHQNATFKAICGSMNEDEAIDYIKKTDKGDYIFRDMTNIENHILKGNFSKDRKYQLLQRNLNLAIWENNETLANKLIDMKIIPEKNIDLSNLVSLNNLELLKKTLDVIKEDPNIINIEKTALLVAIELGNIEAIELILSKDTKIAENIIRENIPLQQPTDKGLRGIVNHLIKKRKNHDTKNMSIKTTKDEMNDLPPDENYRKDLKLPSDVYIKTNSSEEYPMHIAIEHGKLANNGRGTVAFYIVTYPEKLEEIELILEKNAKVDKKNNRRNEPYEESTDKGFFHKFHHLMENKVSPDINNLSGKTSKDNLIELSSDKHHCENTTVPPNIYCTPNQDGTYSVHLAIESGNFEELTDNGFFDMVQHLIENGANPDISNFSGKTPKDNLIELSSNKNHCENLTLPANIYSTPNQDGKYSIHLAMESGNVENIIFVASKTPNVVFEQDNWKIMQYACKRGIAEIVKMLIDKAPTNVFDKVNSDGNTLMHLACGSGNSEIVKLLIAKTPLKVLSQKNNSRNTPKDLASNSKSINILESAELKHKILSRISSLDCRPNELSPLK